MRSMNRPIITHAATFAVAALTTALTAPAVHSQTYYNNLTAFNAAATTGALYTFEDIATPGNFATNPAVLVTPAPGRITFAVTGGADTSVYAFDAAVTGGIYTVIDGTDSVAAGLSVGGNLATTRINLDAAYTAFAIELGQQANIPDNYTIGLYNGNTQIGTNFVSGTVGDIFFGATSVTAFDNVRVLSDPGRFTYTVFDNARNGSAIVAVPEAGSLALVLPALALVGADIVRRKRAA